MTIVCEGAHHGLARGHGEEVITRRTPWVNRRMPPGVLMEKVGRVKYISPDVLEAMPRGRGQYKTVHLFLVPREINDAELEEEYRRRNMVAADPDSLIAINQRDVYLSNPYENATHWQGEDGEWYALVFRFNGYFPYVGVLKVAGPWPANCRFAGVVRKGRES